MEYVNIQFNIILLKTDIYIYILSYIFVYLKHFLIYNQIKIFWY